MAQDDSPDNPGVMFFKNPGGPGVLGSGTPRAAGGGKRPGLHAALASRRKRVKLPA